MDPFALGMLIGAGTMLVSCLFGYALGKFLSK